LLELGSKSFTLWDEDVVIEIMGIEEFSFLVLDFLFKSSNFSVVDVCSSVEFMMDTSQLFLQLTNKLFNFTVEFVKETSGFHVEFSIVDDELAPTRCVDFSKSLLVTIGPN